MKVPVIVGKKYISFVSDLGVHGEGIGKIDGFTSGRNCKSENHPCKKIICDRGVIVHREKISLSSRAGTYECLRRLPTGTYDL